MRDALANDVVAALARLLRAATPPELSMAKNNARRVLRRVEMEAIAGTQSDPVFDGVEYDPAADDDRLRKQMGRIYELMRGGKWFTLAEIEKHTGDPAASISAQLRHLRKKRFGSYVVERDNVGDGVFAYRLLSPTGEIIGGS